MGKLQKKGEYRIQRGQAATHFRGHKGGLFTYNEAKRIMFRKTLRNMKTAFISALQCAKSYKNIEWMIVLLLTKLAGDFGLDELHLRLWIDAPGCVKLTINEIENDETLKEVWEGDILYEPFIRQDEAA